MGVDVDLHEILKPIRCDICKGAGHYSDGKIDKVCGSCGGHNDVLGSGIKGRFNYRWLKNLLAIHVGEVSGG